MSRHNLVIGYQAQTLIWTCILLANDVLGVTVDEVKTVREGETVTLHTGFTGLQSDVQILWLYGPVDPDTKIVQSQVLRGEIITDYSDKFRDRLQLDRQTGSLTIRNINITDSGVYKVQIIIEKVKARTFRYIVFATVPAPHIGVEPQGRLAVSGSSGPKCSVVCSVKNGINVTLFWYKGKEILKQTSSPDLNTILSLPLEIEDQDNNIYSCVADNPVSNQTTQFNIIQLCPMFERSPDSSENIWLIPVIILICALVILVFMVWYIKRRRQQGSSPN